MSPILVFGFGNPSRGDDALGPRLVEALQSEFAERSVGDIEFLTDFQLQIEHALDLAGRSLVLFADAHVSCAPPFDFRQLVESQDDSYTTHAMSPASVLHVFRQVCRATPPPAFLLGIRGSRFGLGEELDSEAQYHLTSAVAFCRDLLARPELTYWRSRCSDALSLAPAHT